MKIYKAIKREGIRLKRRFGPLVRGRTRGEGERSPREESALLAQVHGEKKSPGRQGGAFAGR